MHKTPSTNIYTSVCINASFLRWKFLQLYLNPSTWCRRFTIIRCPTCITMQSMSLTAHPHLLRLIHVSVTDIEANLIRDGSLLSRKHEGPIVLPGTLRSYWTIIHMHVCHAQKTYYIKYHSVDKNLIIQEVKSAVQYQIDAQTHNMTHSARFSGAGFMTRHIQR